jgi:hypothetical protein
MCPGTTRVSARVKFWVACSGKVPGSDSGMESGTVSEKGLGKRLGKNSGKEAGQDREISLLQGQSELMEEI